MPEEIVINKEIKDNLERLFTLQNIDEKSFGEWFSIFMTNRNQSER